ncbi:MAG TPA: hypothetical protein VFN49_11770 [Candidatus Aquilonibacter sp.]|nr:hypothetical protein [Candidatus Aquilonibacter sp.]
MLFSSGFTVYALGLRHGADPDHLAAIDTMTRNSYAKAPRLSRLIGTLFAGGHTVMVLAIATLVGFAGTRLTAHRHAIEEAGTWISIVVLLALAALNARQLRSGTNGRFSGAKTRLLGPLMRDGATPWVALPIGLLFGFGFETSSQVAAYAMAFGADAGVAGALVVGSMFCAGMVSSDTLDSLFVHRLVSYRAGSLPRVMRVWIGSITALAVAVAAFEFAQLLGYQPPVSDVTVSLALVGALLAIFAGVFIMTRRSARVTSQMEQLL